MAEKISVHLPEKVWEAIADYEPYPRPASLPRAIRRQLRRAARIEIRQPVRQAARVVTLSQSETDQLLLWLRAVSIRADAPREACRAAIAGVTAAKRRSA